MCISQNPSLKNVSNRKGKTISSKDFFSKYVYFEIANSRLLCSHNRDVCLSCIVDIEINA